MGIIADKVIGTDVVTYGKQNIFDKIDNRSEKLIIQII